MWQNLDDLRFSRNCCFQVAIGAMISRAYLGIFLLSTIAVWEFNAFATEAVNERDAASLVELTTCCPQTPIWKLSLQMGQGVNSNLHRIPGQLVLQSIPWENTWYYAFIVQKYFARWSGIDWAVESSLLKHYGMQNNFESTVAGVATIKGVFSPWIGSAVSFGEGLSYAYSSPTFEKGADSSGRHQVKLQNHLVFEAELIFPTFSSFSIAARLHHRSGVYGIFGPRRIGSNFLATGIKLTF